MTGANTDPAQCVFCPFCGGAAPWHSFKFPTAVARLQRLIFRSGAVPAHMVECAGAVRSKIFTLKYLYTIIQDHSTKSRTARITLSISLYDHPCELYCGLGCFCTHILTRKFYIELLQHTRPCALARLRHEILIAAAPPPRLET